MGRKRRTERDENVDRKLGDTLARLRKERGWKLEEVAARLGMSTSYLSALEGGQYTFKVALLERMVKVFQVPFSTFIKADAPPQDDLDVEWSEVYQALSLRDRMVLLDLGRKLSSWPDSRGPSAADADPSARGKLVSIEGIDGDHINQVGLLISDRLGRHNITYCPYRYECDLWKHMMARFAKLDLCEVENRALERTLLFAGERMLRYHEGILPALRRRKTVVAPFFAMASGVYQGTEGVGDRRLVDIIEALLPRPDVIVVLISDPAAAAKKAVKRTPGAGQFYSSYDQAHLTRAAALYRKSIQEFRARGCPIHEFDTSAKGWLEAVTEALRGLTAAKRSALKNGHSGGAIPPMPFSIAVNTPASDRKNSA